MEIYKVNKWLFFDRVCHLCRSARAGLSGLCDGCQADLPWLISSCSRCAESLSPTLEHPRLCDHCRHQPPSYDQVLAPLHYRFPLTELMPLIKYHRHPSALGWLSATLALWLCDRVETPPQCLLPVPIHPWRLFERGFNQSALIADQLSKRLNVPWDDRVLRKIRRTGHQADLNRQQRLANLRDSFQCCRPVPNHVAIIDDVMTTGSTVHELARILRLAGATRIDVWVLARTPA